MLKESLQVDLQDCYPRWRFIIFTVLLTTCGENVVSDDVPDEMQRVAKEVVTDRFGIPRGEYRVEGRQGGSKRLFFNCT